MSEETEHAQIIGISARLQSALLICDLKYWGIAIPNDRLSDTWS